MQDPILTTRKAQQLGSSTLGVTLPADWTRKYAVDKGDELHIRRNEATDTLLIEPDQPENNTRKVHINAGRLTDSKAITQAVATQYVLGRDIVHVESPSLTVNHTDAVLEAERQCLGLGIVAQTDSQIIIRCTATPENFALTKLIRRVCETEANMRSEVITALVEGDTNPIRNTRRMYEQVQKLSRLFKRIEFMIKKRPGQGENCDTQT